MRPITILAVFCGHADFNELPDDFERFSWLGHKIARDKPDVVIIGGDWWNNPSISPHLGSTLIGMPGKEAPAMAAKHDVMADWTAGMDAMIAVLSPYRADNERHRRAGHREREYNPTIYFLEGNHEDFWTRVKTKHPALKSLISSQAAIEFLSGVGVEWVPMREKLFLRNIAFQHFHPDDRRQPIPPTSLMNTLLMSNVSGHKHIYYHHEKVRADGIVLQSIVGGCWKSPSVLARPENYKMRGGLIMMNDVRTNGEFHHRFIPQEVVAREYREGIRGLAAA